jgi:glycine/D-amino acid oxidase-like deaminating enzyme
VVGAGIVGAATARALAVRGVEVDLIDCGEVSGGTTGLGEGNVLCSDKEGGPELALAVLGRAAYDEIEARYGEVARIRRKGALVVHRTDAGLAAEPARIERLRAAGVTCELLEPEQARALEPVLAPDLLGATWVPGDLQCDPRAIARAMAVEAHAAGARVHTHTHVEQILPGEGVRPSPAREGRSPSAPRDGLLRADHVVLAAGPWSAELARGAGLELPLEPRKGQLARLAGGPLQVRHKVVDGGYLAAVAAADAELQVSTVIESTWQGQVLVGSSRERRGFDTAVDPAVTEALLDAAARVVPAVAALAPEAAWAGLRPWLPDGLPALGPSRAVPGLWVATGHEGAGVGLGPISGELLAAALCGEAPALDLAPFDPDRFGGSVRTDPPATAPRPPAARG